MKEKLKGLKEYLIKKLGRKGFTLIELLAVIVILAIVLIVTIPSVISSMNSAKHKQLQNAADTAADWLTKQYELDRLQMGSDEACDDFFDFLHTTEGFEELKIENNKSLGDVDISGNELLQAAGISDVNNNIDLDGSYIWINNNKMCISLAVSGGSFYVSGGDNYAISSGCE